MSERIDRLLKAANERVAAMTPEERAAMYEAQRQSYARSWEPCEHGWRDFEQCPECRAKVRKP